MKQPISLILAAAISTALISAPAFASGAIAIAAFYETGAVGFGSGTSKNKAGNQAKKSCTKNNGGRSCKYWFWSKPANHVVMVRCNFDLGTDEEGAFLVQGGFSETGLAAAKIDAYKRAVKKISYNGLRASDKNCKTIATYSGGKFTQ